ncbi:MAG: indolepyruvate oxidoreductase subunit beta [Bacteroidota bacterium]|nr:indolepyruvate oxidoreductase subunit beta [Bacteroidota bacterium]
MKKDIILAGVGGQGIISIASIIGYAALKKGMFLKQAEVHGMSQRGGDVQSNLRISDNEIYSDLIPLGKADLILAVEPLESLRYLPFLSPEGWLITSLNPFNNVPNYPDVEKITDEIRALPHRVALDADTLAKEAGSIKAANIVVLGAASPFLEIEYEILEEAIRAFFSKKGDKLIQTNLDALKSGRNFTDKQLKA